jgi:hypothetical protein
VNTVPACQLQPEPDSLLTKQLAAQRVVLTHSCFRRSIPLPPLAVCPLQKKPPKKAAALLDFITEARILLMAAK